ncbi:MULTISPECIES: thiamine diphosphokinase [Eubacteriales]|jgi:thiamine pyrophosphokinase|uniref:thiamine diphosphokinase n=1 Tax=Eubacteriales TaxID=186802 RepID=UPI000E42D34B|nr:thiamine diphosphokinase [Eubacterium sp. OM08-24]RGM21584.1 thiamine diphosphokinase [Eubacterium sp. OM08-24]
MRCVIIAGSPDAEINFIAEQVKDCNYLICADKGYEYAKKAGIKPDLIVGDFDSYSGELPDDCEIIKLNSHKDDTDLLHCIGVALSRGYDDFLILAATGGRFDHTFANISTLMYLDKKGAKGEIVSSREIIRFLKKGEYKINDCKGKTFSVFPFACESVNVTYIGAEYSADNLVLTAEDAMGVSNIFTTDKAAVKINYGNAIFILNSVVN